MINAMDWNAAHDFLPSGLTFLLFMDQIMKGTIKILIQDRTNDLAFSPFFNFGESVCPKWKQCVAKGIIIWMQNFPNYRLSPEIFVSLHKSCHICFSRLQRLLHKAIVDFKFQPHQAV